MQWPSVCYLLQNFTQFFRVITQKGREYKNQLALGLNFRGIWIKEDVGSHLKFWTFKSWNPSDVNSPEFFFLGLWLISVNG